MPAVLAALARPLIIWLVQIVITTLIVDAVDALGKQIVAGIAQHYGIAETDAKVVWANQLIDMAAIVGVGTGTLYSKLGVKAADYLGLSASGKITAKLSASAVAKIAAVDKTAGSATKAQGLMGGLLKGETIWKGVLFTMLLQQIGDWFIFGKAQLQGYIDAIFGKGTVALPSGNDSPPPFTNTTWGNYVAGLENAGIVGIEGGAAMATLLYSRDALIQLAWWAYSQQLKNGVNPTEANVKPIISPHLRFKDTAAPASTSSAAPAKTGTTAAASSASGGSSSAGASSQAKETVTPSLSSGTFVAPNTAYIDNAQELQTQAAQALLAFISTLGGSLVLQITTVTHYVDDSGKDHYAGVAQVQAGTNKDGTAKYKKYTGHFAMLSVYYDVPGPGRLKLITIPLGSLNVAAYRPTVDELAQVVLAVSSGTATQVATSLAPQGTTAAAGGTATIAAAGGDTTAPATGGGIEAAAAAAGVSLTPAPTAQQLANRNNPTPVNVQYPTSGLFHNTNSFNEEVSRRVGNIVYQLNFLSPPFDSLYKGVIGAGTQAGIVNAWLKTNFGFDVGSLPTFNYADLTTDSSITLRASYTGAGQPGAGITDPFALVKQFLLAGTLGAGSTTVTLNGPGTV